MNVGDKIKELRKKKDWSQTELAKKMNLKSSNLSRYEAGKIQPSLPIMERFAKVFNVSIDYLLGKNNESSEFIKIKDVELREKLAKVDNLPNDDKNALKKILDGLLFKNHIKTFSQDF